MKNIKSIVNEVIRKEARKEALKILSKSSEKDINEFIKYYKENKYNICCLHLDKLKYDLVKEGKLKQFKKDHFGELFFEFEKENDKLS